MYEHQMECCGWSEMYDLNTWDESEAHFNTFLTRTSSRSGTGRVGGIIFTTNYKNAAGKNKAILLAALLKKLDLGRVVRLPRFVNPNTGNDIYSYVWIVNSAKVLAYKKKLKTAKAKTAKGGMELW